MMQHVIVKKNTKDTDRLLNFVLLLYKCTKENLMYLTKIGDITLRIILNPVIPFKQDELYFSNCQ